MAVIDLEFESGGGGKCNSGTIVATSSRTTINVGFEPDVLVAHDSSQGLFHVCVNPKLANAQSTTYNSAYFYYNSSSINYLSGSVFSSDSVTMDTASNGRTYTWYAYAS